MRRSKPKGVQDLLAWSSQRLGGSWAQPDLGDAGEGGKRRRQRRDGLVLPDGSGRGTETSVRTSANSWVLVRSPHHQQLAHLLRGAGATVHPEGDTTLAVTGMSTDQIGELAARHDLVLHEVTAREASLEDAGRRSSAAPSPPRPTPHPNRPGSASPCSASTPPRS